MSVFEDIKLGLQQAIDYEKGNIKVRTTQLAIAPLNQYTPEEIKSIRKESKMTQAVFAKYLGVSVKTVESWESGKNHPEGAACRLLSLTKTNPSFPVDSGIVTAIKS